MSYARSYVYNWNLEIFQILNFLNFSKLMEMETENVEMAIVFWGTGRNSLDGGKMSEEIKRRYVDILLSWYLRQREIYMFKRRLSVHLRSLQIRILPCRPCFQQYSDEYLFLHLFLYSFKASSFHLQHLQFVRNSLCFYDEAFLKRLWPSIYKRYHTIRLFSCLVKVAAIAWFDAAVDDCTSMFLAWQLQICVLQFFC